MIAIKAIAIKKFKKNPRLEEFIFNEISVLKKINNINVIKFYDQLKTENYSYYIYEYCNEGTLDDLITKDTYLKEKQAYYFFRQILNGCKALIENNILHRDLKPANILIHNNMIKIADFGFCKKKNSLYNMNVTMVGSP